MAKRTLNKYFLPRPEDLPQLKTPDGEPIPFAQLLAIDVENISAEFEIHSAWLATIGYASAMATADVIKLERALERLRASLYFTKMQEAHAGGTKKTEAAIGSAILLDDQYEAMENQLGAAERRAGILKNALNAYASRRDMLVNLGAEERLNRPKMLSRLED